MALLSAASVAGMAITSVLATSAWLARNEAERQRVRAEAEAETARQTTRFMVDLFKVSDPSEALGNTITAREILDKGARRIDTELKDQPGIQATLMDTMGTVYTSLGLYDSAVPLVRNAVAETPGPARTEERGSRAEPQPSRRGADAQVRLRRGRAVDCAARSRSVARRLGNTHPDVADTLSALADVHVADRQVRRGRAADARGARDPPREVRQRQRGGRRAASKTSDSTTTSAAITSRRSRRCARRSTMRRKLLGEVHPALARAIDNLAVGADVARPCRGGRAATRAKRSR